MEGASQVCKNCKRSVASAHLALHEAHCLLSLVLCPECKEPVSPEKMDEHRENRHQQAHGFGRGKGSQFQERLNVLLRFVKRGSRK